MLHDLIARYGAALVFVNALAASLGLPVPAMPTLIVFGAFAALHPLSAGAELATVLMVAVCATLIGDSVWFFAGRLYGGATLRTSSCRVSRSCLCRWRAPWARAIAHSSFMTAWVRRCG
jgi:membrane protein DedA with SNARE-associated domain